MTGFLDDHLGGRGSGNVVITPSWLIMWDVVVVYFIYLVETNAVNLILFFARILIFVTAVNLTAVKLTTV